MKTPGRTILLILFISLPTLAHSGTNAGQVLKVFFRSDCPPCLQEIKILPEIARAHSNVVINVITLDNKHLQSDFPSNVNVIAGSDKEKEIIRSSGDRDFALPFSMFIRADGTVCGRHYGILGTDLVNTWVRQC